MNNQEIERKFLVKDWEGYRHLAYKQTQIEQGYLYEANGKYVRIRIKGDQGYITVKSNQAGLQRFEMEEKITLDLAKELLSMCHKSIVKTRFNINFAGHEYEVDEFKGKLDGLILAEVELSHANEHIENLPPFIKKEVTGLPQYYNSNLINSSYQFTK